MAAQKGQDGSAGARAARAVRIGHPPSHHRFDWIFSLLCGWLVAGGFLVGWAYNHQQDVSRELNLWNGVLYSGYAACTLFLGLIVLEHHARGHSWARSLPPGYGLSLVGAGIFLAGGLLDLLWTAIFGVATGLVALLTLPHLLIGAGALLMVSGPLRATWHHKSNAPVLPWRLAMPMLLSAAWILAIGGFFTQFAHPLVNTWASAGLPTASVSGDLYVMNADGSGQTRLTTDQRGASSPAWSPDGTQIAFAATRGRSSQIYTMHADGSARTQLTYEGTSNFEPAWSPDGHLILVAVLAGLLVHALQIAPGALRNAVPTPSLMPAALGPVLVLSNVSNGSVILNGTPLAGLPPLVTSFRRGQNTFILTAPPFRPLTCQVLWPAAEVQPPNGEGQPSCDLRRDATGPYHVGGRAITPVAVVDLWFSGDDLLPPERARALANVTALLRTVPLQTHVPVGDYFATGVDAHGQIRSQRALTPLQADVLVTPTDLVLGGDTFCADAAAGCVLSPPQAGGPMGPRWVVVAGLTTAWQFTASDGHSYHAAPYPTGHAPRLVLTYDAPGGWAVDQTATEQLNGYGLPAAMALALYGTVPDLLGALVYQHGYGLATISDRGIEGSELQIQAVNGAVLGTLVWRFGVLLAADAPAHALLPYLPLAPPSEISAVGASSR